MDIPFDAPRPSYTELTQEQRAIICNGVGADWTPPVVRKALTKATQWFFDDASWCHHDFGYSIGYTEKHRKLYDRKFLDAMLSDSSKATGFKKIVAYTLSYTFYSVVRAVGWIGFEYGTRYKTIDEIMKKYQK